MYVLKILQFHFHSCAYLRAHALRLLKVHVCVEKLRKVQQIFKPTMFLEYGVVVVKLVRNCLHPKYTQVATEVSSEAMEVRRRPRLALKK